MNWLEGIQQLEPQDVFVGLVSAVLGLLALVAAMFRWQAPYQLRLVKQVEQRWGRAAAQLMLATVGIVLIGLGIAIALGFRLTQKQKPAALPRSNAAGSAAGLV